MIALIILLVLFAVVTLALVARSGRVLPADATTGTGSRGDDAPDDAPDHLAFERFMCDWMWAK